MKETVSGMSQNIKALIADEAHENQRLDVFVTAHMPEYISRSRVIELIKQGVITLNGKPCKKPNTRIKPADSVTCIIPEAEDPTPEPEEIPLDVLFEDDSVIVINKPAGMVVHPASGNWQGTLVNALLHHCKGSLSGIGGVKRPGIVHRLDKETSGVMVVAKNDQAHQHLAAQFADHGRTGNLKRLYQALVWGEPSPKKGTIETYLGRDSNNRLRRAVVAEGRIDAKLAITHYLALEGYRLNGEIMPQLSLVQCQLETGRTHQIRVHMAHIGHPLLGDREYGAHFKSKEVKLPNEAKSQLNLMRGQALHAKSLQFDHPVTGELCAFETPLPEPMARFSEAFKS
jgi:23S rRNA pseudouridine1911/1915/1917 synthase